MEDKVRVKRNALFQQLKPHCILLSQQALHHNGNPEADKLLRTTTTNLLSILQTKCSTPSSGFDEKLADYVFFPLSHVLKRCQKAPGRLAETTVQCLKVLLQNGWTKAIALDLAIQLLLLLTFFCGGGGDKSPPIAEELQTEAYGALALLFDDIKRTPKGSAALVETSTIPALGHCLSTVLEGITDGPTPKCQGEALKALKSLWGCVKDAQALSTFLPGTISALTKSLIPSLSSPRSQKVLVAGLDVLQLVITTCVGDLPTRNLPDVESTTNGKSNRVTKAWLKATASQIKLALANVVKLRKGQSEEVQRSLLALCLTLLDECHESLAEAAPLLVETAMYVMDTGDTSDDFGQLDLKNLAMVHSSIAEQVKVVAYDWVSNFPSIMQANDEMAKQTMMRQLAKVYKLVSELSLESEVLLEAITTSVQQGVASVVSQSPSKSLIEETSLVKFDSSLILAADNTTMHTFAPLIMSEQSQIGTRTQLDLLLKGLGSPEIQTHMARKTLSLIQDDSSSDRLSPFWLSFQLVKASKAASHMYDEFLTTSLTASSEQEEILDELYYHSLTFLSDDTIQDWRIQAVGLEVVAFQAQIHGEDFRLDLIDALYPIIQLLGAQNSALRAHAITALNMIASSCAYASTSQMIVENVDYLVNAVSLKLNTFDISPQVPQVLIMMLKLSGPSLLPYLDDTVGSIFAALDNFHGYPRLVESLFAVLGEIVQEGSVSNQLRVTSGADINHKKERPPVLTMEDISKILEKTMRRKADSRDVIDHEDFPREPWKSAEELLDETHPQPKDATDDDDDDPTSPPAEEQSVDKPPEPLTKTYTMLQQITRLSQHYLTSSSTPLRQRLLSLITTAATSLSHNENEFLPVINDIWPVVIARLYDPEQTVIIAATTTLISLCQSAGDFLSSRFHNEWSSLLKLAHQYNAKAEAEQKGKHARGMFALDTRVWEALVGLFVGVLEYVRIDDEMFDDVLELLGGLLEEREDVREALEVVNADAVWLERVRRGDVVVGEPPVCEGVVFARWEG